MKYKFWKIIGYMYVLFSWIFFNAAFDHSHLGSQENASVKEEWKVFRWGNDHRYLAFIHCVSFFSEHLPFLLENKYATFVINTKTHKLVVWFLYTFF